MIGRRKSSGPKPFFSRIVDSRWADMNGTGKVGNVLIIATKAGGSNDSFKLSKLDTCK